MKVDEPLMAALEGAVKEVEAVSSIEVVVAFAPQSGIYRDVELAFGAVLAWLVMGELVLAPFQFLDYMLLPVTAGAFVAGCLVGRVGIHRGLIPSKRRRRQVADAARAAFVHEHVGATRDRTGVLVYLSLLEGDLEILPDYGVEAKVPSAFWNDLRSDVLKQPLPQRWMAVADGLRKLAPELSQRLPRKANDKDELPEAPGVASRTTLSSSAALPLPEAPGVASRTTLSSSAALPLPERPRILE